MSGPSTSRNAGDDLCLQYIHGANAICRRPEGHPTIVQDGIGHCASFTKWAMDQSSMSEYDRARVRLDMEQLRDRIAQAVAALPSKDVDGYRYLEVDEVVAAIQECKL